MIGTQQIAEEFRRMYAAGEFVEDRAGGKVVEIIGSSFLADTDGIIRSPNYEFSKREIDWYLSQSEFVKDIGEPVPALWLSVADDEGKVKSNYGYRILSAQCGRQYANVMQTLKDTPDSRRAVMIYADPQNHEQMQLGCKDFVCTNAVNYFVRYGKLHAVVQMRSNDAVYGYCNDYLWQRSVLESLADDLKIEVGEMLWQAASLHVYERHFKFLEETTA